jgi:hypothetical protein
MVADNRLRLLGQTAPLADNIMYLFNQTVFFITTELLPNVSRVITATDTVVARVNAEVGHGGSIAPLSRELLLAGCCWDGR